MTSASPQTDPCVSAVLIPPQLERFRSVCGVSDAPLTADFTGWHKFVLLAPDRVFLFPRNHLYVASLERELAVYATLSRAEQTHSVAVPHLLQRYEDLQISPYPFGAVTRLPGIRYGSVEAGLTLAQVTTVLEGLGDLVARWHNIPAAEIPLVVRQATGLPSTETAEYRGGRGTPEAGGEDGEGGRVTLKSWDRAALQVERCAEAAAFLHDRLQAIVPGPLPLQAWQECLAQFAALPPVLVHGDVHEDQILLESAHALRIAGILDWETARLDHPAWDFDFGEWGLEIWAWKEHFADLRRAMWSAYARARTTAVPDWKSLHLFFTLAEAAWQLHRQEQAPVDRETHRAQVAAALARVTGLF